ncbi:MAG TPA: hypothetical protein QF753_07645 [Victivallales bacterium]|nr:hypothetical protein [Victivallales bacterium]
MKKKLKFFVISIPLIGLFLSGCKSTSVDKKTTYSQPVSTITQTDNEKTGNHTEKAQKKQADKQNNTFKKKTESGALENSKSESVSQPVKPLKYYTKIAQVRIPLQVIVKNSDKNFYRAGRTIAGNIANLGFEITDEKPFLTVGIENGVLTLYDKYGNYYVYKAEAEITVHRNIYDYIKTSKGNYNLLAEDTITSKGTRKLGSSEACKSATKELGKKASNWVEETCKREMSGVKGEKVYLNMSMLRMAFAGLFNNTNSFETCMNEMFRKITARPGILYCMEAGRSNDSVEVEILYRKKDYPNGVFKPAVMSDITFYASSPKGRVNELLGYLLR